MSESDRAFAFFAVPYLGVVIVAGLIALVFALCGCSSPAVSQEPKYPEYEKWWTQDCQRRSTNLDELGQGDILVFSNGMEAVLL